MDMVTIPASGPSRSQCISLDNDAWHLLRVLCPGSKGMGRLLSELIRREAQARVERPQLLAALAAQTGNGHEK